MQILCLVIYTYLFSDIYFKDKDTTVLASVKLYLTTMDFFNDERNDLGNK